MSNLKKDGKLRWAPSYVRRQGQMTPGQKRAFRERWDDFGIEYRYNETIDIDEVFPGKGPLILEIGFGMGENLLHLASRNPECRFLGIEVHKPGIGAVLKEMGERENIRLMRGDARLILEDHITGPVFDRVCIFFPDPWPKPGNDHRRLVQPDFVKTFSNRLKAKGKLHFATDVDDYAEHIRDLMSDWDLVDEIEPNWQRVLSKYEAKGIERGNEIADLVYRQK